ncbi:MAG TPA: PEP-CTERM sorting domain-containing protein [Phycisphaerae bacterium]|nr:PEP-CTERM sorting domain-containing protein [Phycisphaerae bacterium]
MFYGRNGFHGRVSYRFVLWVAAAAAILGGVALRPVRAGETTGLPGNGQFWDWFDPANWSAGVPKPDDDAYLCTYSTPEINGSTALSSLSLYSDGMPSVHHWSGHVTISGALTIEQRSNGAYTVFPGASLSAGEIIILPCSAYFEQTPGSSVQAGLVQVARVKRDDFLQHLESSARTSNPNLPGWLIGGDGKGGDGQITFGFGSLPAIGPILFEHGRSYSMVEVAQAINAASQASLRYDAGGIVYDPNSNEYSLRVEARKPGVHPSGGSYEGNPLTQQGLKGGDWQEECGSSAIVAGIWYHVGGGALEVDRLHLQGGILGGPGMVTVTDELFVQCESGISPGDALEFRMVGADLKNAALELVSMWNRVTMRFLPSEKTARVEVDAIDLGADPAVWEPIAPKSMIFGALHVGSAIELVDEYGNQLHGGVEALYVHDLVMEPGGWIGGRLNLYYLNGGEPKQFFRGDANLDGKVGLIDLTILADGYGLEAGADWGRGDFNGDGVVGIADLVVLADNYGAATQPAGAAAVPEPSTLAALSAGWIGAFLARKR